MTTPATALRDVIEALEQVSDFLNRTRAHNPSHVIQRSYELHSKFAAAMPTIHRALETLKRVEAAPCCEVTSRVVHGWFLNGADSDESADAIDALVGQRVALVRVWEG